MFTYTVPGKTGVLGLGTLRFKKMEIWPRLALEW